MHPWPGGEDPAVDRTAVSAQPGVPPPAVPAGAGWRRGRFLSLAATAMLALGIGGGAVAVAADLNAGAAPSAEPSISAGPGASGSSAVTLLTLLGQVLAVGRDSVTFGEPGGTVTAAVTSATRFTGHVHSLRGVQRGDQVAAQVRVTNGVARLVTIQDPAS